MSKHTPGPWRCDEFHGTPEDIALGRKHGIEPVQALSNEGQRFIMSGEDEDGNIRRIALVDCQVRFKRGSGHKTECPERDANARLIAAAPDLLAALERIADESAATWVTDVAREAIRKATQP